MGEEKGFGTCTPELHPDSANRLRQGSAWPPNREIPAALGAYVKTAKVSKAGALELAGFECVSTAKSCPIQRLRLVAGPCQTQTGLAPQQLLAFSSIGSATHFPAVWSSRDGALPHSDRTDAAQDLAVLSAATAPAVPSDQRS